MEATNPETYSPAAIDQEIREVIRRIEKGVTTTADAAKIAASARREFDEAMARATLRASDMGLPNAEARKAWAVLETMPQREKAEVLEEAHKYAVALGRALVSRLDGLRSLLVSARTLYSEVGRGEP